MGARVSHGTPAENYDNLRHLYSTDYLLILMFLASILGYFKALRLKKSHSFWGSNPQTPEILLKLSAIINLCCTPICLLPLIVRGCIMWLFELTETFPLAHAVAA